MGVAGRNSVIMSILLGPYEKAEEEQESVKEDDIKDLMVFGYQCKFYRDDVKAELENSGSMLIPWMGDSSLMVDRYDIRNHFDDKSQFGFKPNLPPRKTEQEKEFELLLDEERYRFLGNDVLEKDLEREEEQKRQHTAGTYRAVGFSYNNEQKQEEDYPLMDQPELPEHPPTSSVDIVEGSDDAYQDPPDLTLPLTIERPLSKKLYSIIEHTAKFISTQGQQMEIIIKTKQKHNASFSFLHHEDRLFPFYKQLLHAIMKGTYIPTTTSSNKDPVDTGTDSPKVIELDPEPVPVKQEETVVNEEQSDLEKSESDDEESFELHPLLRTSLTSSILSKSNKKNDKKLQNSDQNGISSKLNSTSKSHNNKFSTDSFRTVALTINSAPTVTDTSNDVDSQQEEVVPEDTKPLATNNSCAPGTNETAYTTTYPGYDMMSAYYHASQIYQSGPPPPPPDIQPIVDKTADYVAKNGDSFQNTIVKHHLDDRRFDFLHPWNQYNAYYKAKVLDCREKRKDENTPFNMQKLNSQGAVSFKLSSKPVTTLTLPIGVVDLHYDEDDDDIGAENRANKRTLETDERRLNKKQKLTLDSGGQIDGEFKKFLSTVRLL